jgi:CheY-like chemotaxis protein
MSTTPAPTVYFIDDSATMREVIKIAFRRENINVVACHDAVSALAEIEKARPDVVISDVIMPAKDGYEVCQFIKSHPDLCGTPVVLMSGIVNRSVAERAFAVKADELLRKPFQPQDLITRVRHLLAQNNPPSASAPAPALAPPNAPNAALTLSSIFSSAPPQPRTGPGPFGPQPVPIPRAVPAVAAAPAAAKPTLAHANGSQANGAQAAGIHTAAIPADAQVTSNGGNGNGNGHTATIVPVAMPLAAPGKPLATVDASRLKIEIARLEGLVRKLQSELEAERQYSRALEEHVKTLQEAE